MHYEKFADGSVKCIEDEIPFELPEGWAWVKINTIAFVTKLAGFEYTKNIAPSLCKDGIPLFKGKNVQNSTIVYEFESFIPEAVSDELQRSQVTKKCILTPYVGTIGNIGIHNRPGKYHLGSNVGKIELYNDNVVLLEEYVVAYLQSGFGYQQLTKHMKATAQASISIEAIRDVYLPIPPANEQLRMWSALSNALAMIERIENTELDITNLIKSTKSKILDLAIRGQLVPQDPNDEPASVLLERIRAEKKELIKQGKIKRDKKESVIFKGDDNSYYGIHLPDSWNWASLREIALSISDGSHNPPPNNGSGIPLLSAANINDNSILMNEISRWITNEEWEIENQRTNIEVGDVLLTIVGSIGRSAVVQNNYHFALQRSVAVIKPCLINPLYLMYIVQSPQIQKWLTDNSKGTAQKGIYLNALSLMIIPIPPLAEQARIVEHIHIAYKQLDLILNALL